MCMGVWYSSRELTCIHWIRMPCRSLGHIRRESNCVHSRATAERFVVILYAIDYQPFLLCPALPSSTVCLIPLPRCATILGRNRTGQVPHILLKCVILFDIQKMKVWFDFFIHYLQECRRIRRRWDNLHAVGTGWRMPRYLPKSVSHSYYQLRWYIITAYLSEWAPPLQF